VLRDSQRHPWRQQQGKPALAMKTGERPVKETRPWWRAKSGIEQLGDRLGMKRIGV
jgi:hypothetical protein